MRLLRATLQAPAAGFSLVELALVLMIVGILMLSLMSTLSSQIDQRNIDDTRRRLEQARELVLSFLIVNGRLPCPARSTSAGAEVRVSDADVVVANRGKCQDAGGIEDYYGGALGTGAGLTGGYLPAQSIGFQHLDGSGFAVDAWQNRIRYAVAKSVASGTCSGPFVNPHFVHAANMKANGIACQPGDLLICKSTNVSPALTTSSCGGTPAGANQIMSQSLVVAIIFSTGKNGPLACATCTDEAANLDGAGNVNPIFVFHTPTPSSFTTGEFDDQFIWITVGELYGKLIAAGVLP